MSLKEQAASDLVAIFGDEDADLFATEITCTDELGVSASIMGQAKEIALVLDPDTDVMVTGKQASVVILQSAIMAAGLTVPKAVADDESRPWTVSWVAADASTRTFRVADTRPDDTRGLVTLLLETYES